MVYGAGSDGCPTMTARRTDAGNAANGFQSISSDKIALKTSCPGWCDRTCPRASCVLSAACLCDNCVSLLVEVRGPRLSPNAREPAIPGGRFNTRCVYARDCCDFEGPS